MESTGPVVARRDPLCLLGSGNAVDEGGNSTCTKPSEDAELGGFANTREIREVRKKLQETQRPSLENAKQIHLEGNRGRPQRSASRMLLWGAAPLLGEVPARVLPSARQEEQPLELTQCCLSPWCLVPQSPSVTTGAKRKPKNAKSTRGKCLPCGWDGVGGLWGVPASSPSLQASPGGSRAVGARSFIATRRLRED